MHKPVNLV